MEERFCPAHKDVITSICFFEGCNEHLLCNKCIECHPDSYDSKIKIINALSKEEDWISYNEERRDSQIVKLLSYSQDKNNLFNESQKKFQEMISDVIEYIKNRLFRWIEELDGLYNQEGKEAFVKLEEELGSLKNLNFREGDLYEKVHKGKIFDESVLPKSTETCQLVQNALDKVRIEQDKIDSYKQEIFELLDSIRPQDLFALSNSKFQRPKELMDSAPNQCEEFRKSRAKQFEDPSKEIEHLEKVIEKLTTEGESLQNQVLMLKTELDSMVSANVKLTVDIESLSRSHVTLEENCCKADFLSEDSKIIRDEDVQNIRKWILPVFKPNKISRCCKLNLLYKATRDGFNSSKFYEKCGNNPSTISFIKSKEHGRVFGGYTSQIWDINKNGYIMDKDAFLFSLTHREKYPIKDPKNAFFAGKGYILCFGSGIFSSETDIYLFDGPSIGSIQGFTDFTRTYDRDRGTDAYLAGSERFVAEEIEVYEVVWS